MIRVKAPTQAAMCLLGSLFAAAAQSQSIAERAPLDATRGVLSYADLIEPVLPAVVAVHVKGESSRPTPPKVPGLERFFQSDEGPRETQQAGTGFVIDAAGGLIVTASFVLDDAKEVTVKLHDGRMLEASVVGKDAESQIGLLRVKPGNLKPLSWGDSRGVRPGDVVFAIGHPYNLGRAVTVGVVSGVTQGDDRLEGREMIMTDATIARGYAGGPLIDSKGRVIGVAVAIYTGGNDLQLSFAAPAALAERVVKDLAAHGRVKRASLGVEIGDAADQDLEDGLQVNSPGVTILSITPESSAARAGLKVSDVIVKAAGKPMRNSQDLRAVVQASEVGAPLEIVYRRDGAERAITIPLGEAPP